METCCASIMGIISKHKRPFKSWGCLFRHTRPDHPTSPRAVITSMFRYAFRPRSSSLYMRSRAGARDVRVTSALPRAEDLAMTLRTFCTRSCKPGQLDLMRPSAQNRGSTGPCCWSGATSCRRSLQQLVAPARQAHEAPKPTPVPASSARSQASSCEIQWSSMQR